MQQKFYSLDGILKQDKTGIAMVRYKYDEYGNAIESRNYGTDEELKDNIDAIAMFVINMIKREIILKQDIMIQMKG